MWAAVLFWFEIQIKEGAAPTGLYSFRSHRFRSVQNVADAKLVKNLAKRRRFSRGSYRNISLSELVLSDVPGTSAVVLYSIEMTICPDRCYITNKVKYIREQLHNNPTKSNSQKNTPTCHRFTEHSN